MPKTSALDNVVELLQTAADEGRIVMVLPGRRGVPQGEPPLVTACMLRFALTRAEGRLLGHLLSHGHATKEALHAAMMSMGDLARNKNVDVVICRLRRKLNGHGVAIDTLRGADFALAAGAGDKLHELLGELDAKPDA